MSKRKTDGERIAARLYCLEIDDQEPKWLSAQIDRLVRRRMAEAWAQGYESGFRYGELAVNPYQGRRKKA